jgi:hypothetical protein
MLFLVGKERSSKICSPVLATVRVRAGKAVIGSLTPTEMQPDNFQTAARTSHQNIILEHRFPNEDPVRLNRPLALTRP